MSSIIWARCDKHTAKPEDGCKRCKTATDTNLMQVQQLAKENALINGVVKTLQGEWP